MAAKKILCIGKKVEDDLDLVTDYFDELGMIYDNIDSISDLVNIEKNFIIIFRGGKKEITISFMQGESYGEGFWGLVGFSLDQLDNKKYDSYNVIESLDIDEFKVILNEVHKFWGGATLILYESMY